MVLGSFGWHECRKATPTNGEHYAQTCRLVFWNRGLCSWFWLGRIISPCFICDIELWSRKILAKHWPDVKIAEDVKELANDPDGLVPDCDILTAGYPCQPFSVAGKQRGEEDDRHIWPEIFRIIKAKDPIGLFAKMFMDTSAWGSTQCFLTWKPKAILPTVYCSSLCRQRPTQKGGFGLWATPRTTDGTGGPRQLDERTQNKQVRQFSVRGKLSRPSENVAYTNNKRSQGRLSGGKDAERQSEHGHTRCSSAVHRQPTEEW